MYAIRHVHSGRFYIGSSVNIYARFASHRCALRKGRHHAKFLQRAWTKYGEEAFVFEALEECAAEMLRVAEQRHMDARVDVLMNSAPHARDCIGVRYGPMPEERKRRISETQKGVPRPYARIPATEERKRKIGDSNRGKPKAAYDRTAHSDETRAKISATLKGRPTWWQVRGLENPRKRKA